MSGDDLDLLADEYLLGLLDEAEGEAFERALEREPLLREAVERSCRRFVAFDLCVQVLPAAPEALWSRVSERLRAPWPAEAASPADPAVSIPAAALSTPAPAVSTPAAAASSSTPAPRPALRPAARARPPRSWLRRNLATGIAAGVGLAVGTLLGMEAFQPDPVVLTVLVTEAGAPLAVIEDYGDSAARVRFVAGVSVPEGRQMQVWTLPSPETGPVSLGLLDGASSHLLRGPELPAPADGQLYEITLEQRGGSPTGRPTGPIVAKGLAAAQDI